MSQELRIRPPELFEEWLATNFWLDNSIQVIEPAFSQGCAASLYNSGLCRISNAWIPTEDKFLSLDQAAKKFGIRKGEFSVWTSVCQQMVGIGGCLRRQARSNPGDNDWFGLFNQPTDHTLQFVIQRKFV
jgi:hypothetical protein